MDAQKTIDLDPVDVERDLRAHAIVLIDVREPHEYAAERIPGALLFPLSTFDPLALPSPSDRPLVFHCGGGRRSGLAIDKCRAAGLDGFTHVAGGLGAWKKAGLPTIQS
jgi:rhodanese-related sulfurtransferase